MKVVVEAPEEFSGAVLGSLNRRRGMIVGHLTHGHNASIEADVPLAEMFGYSEDLRGLTQGKGEFSMEFKRYTPVPAGVQEKLTQEHQERRAAK